ncbi:hypothetical protein [Pseudomonas oryzihabitans]|uniref:hypothetical protein n=1 Tax=Pseudomonas oryzihabitans TaxID=47885 RepID=UPI0024203A60|nr:hypothetical protein [Pseudomonas oryzihabitans]
MGLSEWIALGAAAASSVISIISWRWARASAQEAKLANALQLHSYRESLYVAFHELHGRFRAFQEHLSFEQVQEFHRHSIACALYLSPHLGRQINSFYAKVILIRAKGEARQKALDEIYKHKDDPYLKDQFDSASRIAQELFEEIKQMAAEANSIGDAALAALKKEVCIDLPEFKPR